jgi:histidinol dehydrogenase
MMKRILFPLREEWDVLCKRPVMDKSDLDDTVRSILDRVRSEGDKAIIDYSLKFDNISLSDLKVSQDELNESVNLVPDDLKAAIGVAKKNIEKFHASQLFQEAPVDTTTGVKCWRKNVPIEKVGLYIPGGTASLFSTVLMLAIPARIAGCNQIVISTPPGINGRINPVILYTALITRVTEIYKVGGAQAVAALAYGTETVPKVYKIFGPGNQFVTKAKEIVQSEGIAIDMLAGPSEVLVIADATADPGFIAADLLSQAEHGSDSQVIFVTNDEKMAGRVSEQLEKQVEKLPRKAVALMALKNSISLLFSSLKECIDFSNTYAPEHLIINTSDAEALAERVINAGSVFIGKYSCESAGDYASGTNHTLPTNGFAKSYNGVSTESFIKKITFQKIEKEGIKILGPVIEIMAEAESLSGHKNAVKVRLKSLSND